MPLHFLTVPKQTRRFIIIIANINPHLVHMPSSVVADWQAFTCNLDLPTHSHSLHFSVCGQLNGAILQLHRLVNVD